MVTIITGPINSGKTTKMSEIYMTKGGDGFVSLKLMGSDRVTGFDIMKLSTDEKAPFIRRSQKLPEGWCENCRLGPYSVSQKAIDWVNESIGEMIAHNRFPIYLDEAGILELEDKCLYTAVDNMLNSDGDIFITVRDTYKDALLEKFSIKKPKIIHIGERYA